jgi:pyruvate ferredoxin oxidoreductase gamma subunit
LTGPAVDLCQQVEPGGADDGGSGKEAGTMFQVRIHGRGGQGVVSGAEMLSVAAFVEGRHAQAFPSFGSERMGAPVMAFCRIDDRPIRLREPVTAPDALIVQDTTLLHQVDLFNGLKPGGRILFNSTRSLGELGLAELAARFRVSICPASELAMKHVGRAVPNVPLLASFAALTGLIRLESVVHAIRDKFPAAVADNNVRAAEEAHALALAQAEDAHA